MSATYIFLFLAAVAMVVVAGFIRAEQKSPARDRPRYQYSAKSSLMTARELDFFRVLEAVAREKYYIAPQVHLSVILDQKIRGQSWEAAFRHINGKSVDYVLCDPRDFRPIYAVELDDSTHARPDRESRDREVERILAGAGIPLVRFANYENLTADDIAEKFIAARQKIVNR